MITQRNLTAPNKPENNSGTRCAKVYYDYNRGMSPEDGHSEQLTLLTKQDILSEQQFLNRKHEN